MTRLSRLITEDGARRLTPREYRFVLAFVACGDPVLAARRAGYPVKYVDDLLADLMSSPTVQSEILRQFDLAESVALIDRDGIVKALSLLAVTGASQFLEVQDDGTATINLAEMLPEQLDCIQEVTVDESVSPVGEVRRRVKVKMYDRIRALELLARIIGAIAPNNVHLTVQPKTPVAAPIAPEDAERAYMDMLGSPESVPE